jgi:hypothetical protein
MNVTLPSVRDQNFIGPTSRRMKAAVLLVVLAAGITALVSQLLRRGDSRRAKGWVYAGDGTGHQAQ